MDNTELDMAVNEAIARKIEALDSDKFATACLQLDTLGRLKDALTRARQSEPLSGTFDDDMVPITDIKPHSNGDLTVTFDNGKISRFKAIE